MYTLTIASGFINIQDTVLDNLQSVQVTGVVFANEMGHVAIHAAGKSIMLHPTLIDSINGADIDGESIDEIIAIMQVASILPSGSGSLDIIEVTASAGIVLEAEELLGKTVHVVFLNNIAATRGFALASTTITFSDGTAFAGGETVKILVS